MPGTSLTTSLGFIFHAVTAISVWFYGLAAVPVVVGIGLGFACCCSCRLCTAGGDFLQLDVGGSADDDNNCAACAGYNDSYLLDLTTNDGANCCYWYHSAETPCSTTACTTCNDGDCSQICDGVLANNVICDPGQSGADCPKTANVTAGASCPVCPDNIDCGTPTPACAEGEPLGDCQTCDCIYDVIDDEWYCDCIETDACVCSATCMSLAVTASLCLTVDEFDDIRIHGEIAGPSGITYGIDETLTGSGNPIDCLTEINGLNLYTGATIGGESAGHNLCTRFTTITLTAV